jgi:hypothetical protein
MSIILAIIIIGLNAYLAYAVYDTHRIVKRTTR